jgi:hypothetical protein
MSTAKVLPSLPLFKAEHLNTVEDLEEQLVSNIRAVYQDGPQITDVVHRHYRPSPEVLAFLVDLRKRGLVVRDEFLESFYDTSKAPGERQLMKDDLTWLRLRSYFEHNDGVPTEEEKRGLWTLKVVQEDTKSAHRIHYQAVHGKEDILKALSALWKNEDVARAPSLMSVFPCNVVSFTTYRFTPNAEHQPPNGLRWWIDCAIIPNVIDKSTVEPLYFTVLTSEWNPPEANIQSPRNQFEEHDRSLSKAMVARAIRDGGSSEDAKKHCEKECPFPDSMLPH